MHVAMATITKKHFLQRYATMTINCLFLCRYFRNTFVPIRISKLTKKSLLRASLLYLLLFIETCLCVVIADIKYNLKTEKHMSASKIFT